MPSSTKYQSKSTTFTVLTITLAKNGISWIFWSYFNGFLCGLSQRISQNYVIPIREYMLRAKIWIESNKVKKFWKKVRLRSAWSLIWCLWELLQSWSDICDNKLMHGFVGSSAWAHFFLVILNQSSFNLLVYFYWILIQGAINRTSFNGRNQFKSHNGRKIQCHIRREDEA